MSATSSLAASEGHIVDRYERIWRRWQPQYDYKHAKGERIAQILQKSGGLPAVALEVGVGPGGIAAVLARRGTRVIGVDLSPYALMQAQAHCRATSVDLLRGSAFSLPLTEGSLPLVYASQVLHLWDSERRFALMREIRRVLRPGGRFVFDMKNASTHLFAVSRYSAARRHKQFPPHAEIEMLLRRAGFASITKMPGVLPLVHWARVPDIAALRPLTHTTFFIAR